MLNLIFIELQIFIIANITAFCIMEYMYPGWRKCSETQGKNKENLNTLGTTIRLSEALNGHMYTVKWIRTNVPFKESETIMILSNADGYVRFKRNIGNGVFIIDHDTAVQIAVKDIGTYL